MVPSIAFAIPSPELIIGSASAVGQAFAVVAAIFSGVLATVASRLGFKSKGKPGSARHWRYLWLGLFALLLISVFANVWQFSLQNRAQETRLQSTLIRPASFAGTQIKDKNLIETSFDAQKTLSTSITTDDAFDLLQRLDSQDIQFVDIRETAERQMGGLPNSSHIRFPDIEEKIETFRGKTVVIYCHNGNRSSETCAKLAQKGIDCRFIAGGIEKWIVEGRPFTDTSVRGLSDLRSLPSYKNKDVLISTLEFQSQLNQNDIQIIDTRYPADFASGHLPNAINIPLRAMPTRDLESMIASLERKPTIAACYDRRSCFMAQALGWELSRNGIDFLGRYTTPWDYFVAPKPKPHIVAWQAETSSTLWTISVDFLASVLVFVSHNTHFLVAIIGLSVISRILVLPIAIKSDRDQIKLHQNAQELKELKQSLGADPVRKARALKRFYAKHGLTPVRNMSALLFLPVMMLGLGAIREASASVQGRWLWIDSFSMPDPIYLLPLAFSVSAGIYFYWAIAKTRRSGWVWLAVSVPVLFVLTYQIAMAGQVYLGTSILLLFLQRMYVTKQFDKIIGPLVNTIDLAVTRFRYGNLIPLAKTRSLQGSGNKSLRLSKMINAGFPVPNGIVIDSKAIKLFQSWTKAHKQKMVDTIAKFHDGKFCAVRSSACDEDGENNSFAGIFDTVLNVEPEGLCDAIETVIASFSSEKSLQYVQQNHSMHGNQEFAGNIVIQKMVTAKYAGVLFTQDPQAAGLVMIEMVEGNGDDLVSGRVTPITLRFGRFTRIADQDQKSPIDFEPLLRLAQQAETLFGCPQDIEWTFDGKAFQIVQSRDITADAICSPKEKARRLRWQAVFDLNTGSDPDRILLQQDEMAEVLPRPTTMSFSIMKAIWGAGGSVDLAARSLGLTYDVLEGGAGHLINLFGKLYSDPVAKNDNAVQVKKRDIGRLRKEVTIVEGEFNKGIMPTLTDRAEFYSALDFKKLSKTQLLKEIDYLFCYFTCEIYAFSEKVNILADFAYRDAMEYCKTNDLDPFAELAATPLLSQNGIIAQAGDLKDSEQKRFLIDQMGHRSLLDYEIADPRYCEIPDTLYNLAKMPHHTSSKKQTTSRPTMIEAAIQMQELKEAAKHNSLRIYALLRNALMAFDKSCDLGGRVFYLGIDEVLDCDLNDLTDLLATAHKRANLEGELAQYAPRTSTLTLRDCELYSSLQDAQGVGPSGSISGTLIAGSLVFSGRCYVVDPEQEELGLPLNGFCSGDVLICKIIHPAWLENVLVASAVLSEVGGWLSHMAIVAREKNKTMMVGCKCLHTLETGDEIKRHEDGVIKVTKRRDMISLRSAG